MREARDNTIVFLTATRLWRPSYSSFYGSNIRIVRTDSTKANARCFRPELRPDLELVRTPVGVIVTSEVDEDIVVIRLCRSRQKQYMKFGLPRAYVIIALPKHTWILWSLSVGFSAKVRSTHIIRIAADSRLRAYATTAEYLAGGVFP